MVFTRRRRSLQVDLTSRGEAVLAEWSRQRLPLMYADWCRMPMLLSLQGPEYVGTAKGQFLPGYKSCRARETPLWSHRVSTSEYIDRSSTFSLLRAFTHVDSLMQTELRRYWSKKDHLTTQEGRRSVVDREIPGQLLLCRRGFQKVAEPQLSAKANVLRIEIATGIPHG